MRMWHFYRVVVLATFVGCAHADGTVKKNSAISRNSNETPNEITRLLPVGDAANDTTTDPDVVAVREFLDDLFNVDTGSDGTTVEQGRTFGLKRLQFVLLPLIYKMGVMTTMLVVLTVISLKILLIATILLIFKLSSFLAKFHSAWQPHQVDHSHGWVSPPVPQPVHVHLHNGGGQHHGHGQAYSGWDPNNVIPSYGSSGYETNSAEDEHYYYKG